jgi:hypothetical protein
MPGRSHSASACEPYLDFIEISLSKGYRNATGKPLMLTENGAMVLPIQVRIPE